MDKMIGDDTCVPKPDCWVCLCGFRSPPGWWWSNDMKIVRQDSPEPLGDGGRLWRQRLVGHDGLRYYRVGIHARAVTWQQRPNGRKETPSFLPTVKSVEHGANRLLLLFLNQCPPERRQPSAEGEGEGARSSVCPWTWNPGGQSEKFGFEAIQGGLDSKESACSAGDPGSIPGLGTSPGEGNGNPLRSILAWRIPWTEEPDGLQSMGLQRVERD